MADYRLKIKIGEHEFEAEGPTDVVQAQFAVFKELVNSVKSDQATEAKAPPASDTTVNTSNTNGSGQLPLEKIMRTDGRVVSLTVRAASVPESIILMLLGQRQFRGNDAVTGAEILDGLQESGQPVNRVDHTLNRLADEGLIIIIGMNRARRYRLSNAGVTRAQELSRTLIATVP